LAGGSAGGRYNLALTEKTPAGTTLWRLLIEVDPASPGCSMRPPDRFTRSTIGDHAGATA
jgi:hypothetical protein